MAEIRYKKPVYPVQKDLQKYLVATHREIDVPVSYRDLLHYDNSFSLLDKNGKDTLWETVVYDEHDTRYIYESLKKIYAQLKVDGDVRQIDHLYIDRVDYCVYANTNPIRVRIVNEINDLFDYFYIKQADASRIYGMELEHMLSPNKINFLVKGSTLIEEHIQGIPGQAFIKQYLPFNKYNPLRLAKEFVKFNERSLVQLLGDMRNDNFVVEIVPDFDDVYFRFRAIDFDQHGYEGNLRIYMPQFFKENNPIIELGFKTMSPINELQYQREERSRLAIRYKALRGQIEKLLSIMAKEELSTITNITQLKDELAQLYEDDEFLYCKSMGEIIQASLHMLFKYPVRSRRRIRRNYDSTPQLY